jgi:hypothetical protein
LAVVERSNRPESQPHQAGGNNIQKQTLKIGGGPTSRDLPVQAKEATYGGGAAGESSSGRSTGDGSGALPSIQLRRGGSATSPDPETLHQTASAGVSGSGGQLPFFDQIQASFGDHDVSHVRAHTGGAAQQAAQSMGAEAYATGNDVAFGGTPSLHTAAHEAAHVVQQRAGVSLSGGVGQQGDAYEQHADAVADRVVQGKPAGDLLSQMAPGGGKGGGTGVQAKALQFDIKADLRKAIEGWGTDEAAIYARLQSASLAELQAVLADRGLLDEIRADLSGDEWERVLVTIARRMVAAGGSADDAFKVIVTDNDALLDRRLAAYGTIEQQRALLDGVITAGIDAKRVQRAFHEYWNVQVSSAAAVAATTNGGDNGAPSPAVAARDWPIPTLQAIHRQLKALPSQDARSGIWNQLSLTNEPSLINRAAYGGGNYLVGSNASTTGTVGAGYGVTLTAAAAKSQRALQVSEGTRFKVDDSLALDRTGPNKETHKVASIAGNTYTMDADLVNDHPRGTVLDPEDGSGLRNVNWLDATTRHEIAHSLDGGGVDTSGFYAKGEWVLGQGDAGFDAWITAMGGASAWTTNDGSTISDADKATIKATIVDHVNNRKGSMFTALAGNPAHPVMVNQNKAVPVIVAAEQCFRLGDFFYTQPAQLYAANGKRFAISWWYKRFQHHNELVVTDRVADYGLYAPTEFFAEAYTVFYEEAGRTGVKDEDYGRLIRNSDWRSWMRDKVHNRGLAPAGTGASPTPTPAQGGGSAGGGSPAQTADAGARPGGGSRGRASGNPGM